MTTGYTAIIEKKPGTTFAEFAMRCARGIGYLSCMCDHSLDTPIPEVIEPSAYAEERLGEARAKLARAGAMTLDEADALAGEEYERYAAATAKLNAERGALRATFAAMRAKVEAWQPPTPNHEVLKRFMLDQIDGERVPDEVFVTPARQTAAEFKATEIHSATEDVEHWERKTQMARESAAEANDWLRALRESLC